ncbi:hypothetical protein RZY48_001448 [Vibrio navarrensis]|uniref:Uncharacterized protein n=1 Tax=Vibrio navarrensis TaxID=29495 RepID=A0AAI9CTD7_9VIBR|nr:hypothetical protein [Vibrio navarrensis]
MRISILFLVSLSALFTSFSYAATCTIGLKLSSKSWLGTLYGDNPKACLTGCLFRLDDVAVCFPSDGSCVGAFISTGQSCDQEDGLIFGGSVPNDGSGDGSGDGDGSGNGDGSGDGSGSGDNSCYKDGVPDPSCDNQGDLGIPNPAFAQYLNSILNQMPNNIESGYLHAKTAALQATLAAAQANKLNSIDFSIKRLQENTAGLESATASTRNNTANIDKYSQLTYTDVARILSATQSINTSNQSIDKELKNLSKLLTEGAGSEASPELKSIENAVNNTLIPNSYELNYQASTAVNRLNSIKSTLDNNHNSSINYFARRMDELIAAVNSSGGGDGGDNSEVVGAVNSVGTKIDGLGGSLKGMSDKLGGLSDKLDGKGLSKGEHGSLINFGETPLYQETEIEKLTQEVTDLKEQYTEKVNDFKKLFSLNLDSLSNGEYREHFLDFEFANGAKLRAGSSVFPALIDNSGLIAAVILFVAVIAGLRVVMGAKD